MAILGFEVEEIARLLALMESSELDEIEWEGANRYLKVSGLRTASREAAPASPHAHPPAKPSSRLTPPVRGADQKAIASKLSAGMPQDEIALVSPMVGVFFRSGKPGDPPLVEVGQFVTRDQPIGIIEAMKIFSEIPAEHGGIVVAVPAQDGQLVHTGTPLVILKKQD
jgi:acetyl-CoA carboxylase biotin carboxyl carrier protein